MRKSTQLGQFPLDLILEIIPSLLPSYRTQDQLGNDLTRADENWWVLMCNVTGTQREMICEMGVGGNSSLLRPLCFRPWELKAVSSSPTSGKEVLLWEDLDLSYRFKSSRVNISQVRVHGGPSGRAWPLICSGSTCPKCPPNQIGSPFFFYTYCELKIIFINLNGQKNWK